MDIDYEKLIILQKLDLEIRQANFFLETTPQKIEEINKKTEQSAQAAAQAKEKLAHNQKKRRDLENEIKDIKTLISKYKIQLNDIKTNKEYTSLLHEIEEQQKKIDKIEETIISEMLAADDIEKEIKTADQKFIQDKERFLREKDVISQKKKELEEKIQKFSREKEALLPHIPQDQLALYLKIQRRMSGMALSPVTDDFCSMCHMRIRPQVINELREAKKLIFCEACGRILYWKEKDDKKDEAKSGGESKTAGEPPSEVRS